MPKQASITKEMVDKTAFHLVRTHGMEALTARRIAQKIGCSTQPIYKLYRSLDELKANTIRETEAYANKIIFGYRKTGNVFLDAGLGYIHFAATENVLFRVFSIENYTNDAVFGPLRDSRLFSMMEEVLGDALPEPEQRQELFLNTMIYTYGLANLAYSGQLHMTEDEIARRLYKFSQYFAGIELKGELDI